jgi:kinesin family protein 6/9
MVLNKNNGLSDTIGVYCRIRPIKDENCDYKIEETFEKTNLAFIKPRESASGLINNSIENFQYSFNGVFDKNVNQEQVFDRCAKNVVLNAMQGYNGTIFAYGQTGSGKTYTMTGGDGTYQNRGIIPRAISLLYEEAEKMRDKEFSFSVSYLEIYKGHGYDLLDNNRSVKNLKDLPKVTVQSDSSGNIYLKNIKSYVIKAEEDALDKLFIGDQNRVLSETVMNEASTRSHCIFTLNIESKEPGSTIMKYSKLHLVDLAGSERVHKTKSSGETLEEAKSINLSLYFLERFIFSISQGYVIFKYLLFT